MKPLRNVKPKEKLRRTGHLTIRLSKDERALLDDAAERAGLMCGSYARQVLFGAPMPRQVRRPAVEKRVLAQLLGQLGKIGGNLNQIAKATNSGLLVYETEVAAAYADLRAMRDAVLAALGRLP